MHVLTSENRAVITKLEEVSHYPFKSVGHALQFLNDCNPARERSLNVLEQEIRSRPHYADFSGYSPKDIYASLVWAVKKMLRYECTDAKALWNLCNAGDRAEQMEYGFAAQKLGLDPRWAKRVLGRMRDTLQNELVRRELIAPPPPPVDQQH